VSFWWRLLKNFEEKESIEYDVSTDIRRRWFALSQSSPLHDKLVPVAFYLLHHHRCILLPA
jgi:hypothetical protein